MYIYMQIHKYIRIYTYMSMYDTYVYIYTYIYIYIPHAYMSAEPSAYGLQKIEAR